MADSDLLIKINADAKNATKAFNDIKSKTENLESTLSGIAKVSAVGFAALTAEIGVSLKAFEEAEAASRQLSQALQVQGIAAEQVAIKTASGNDEIVSITEAYKSYADSIEAVTGLDGDAITSAQAVAQGFLGNTKITKDLTQAIADYSTKTGDLNSAAELIGRTIGTNTNAFARQGLQLSDSATKSERLAAVLDFVNSKYKGQAEAANQSLGSVKGLATAFGNFQESIGAKFAPAATAVIKFFTELFNFASKNKFIQDIAVGFIAAGAAIAAVGVALPVLAQAFLTVRAAMLAFGVASNLALGGLPLLIGAIVGVISFVAVNWGSNLDIMKAALAGFAEFAKNVFAGLALVFIGAFDFDVEKVKAGLAKIGDAFKEGAEAAAKSLPQETEKAVVAQDKVLADAAQKRRVKEQQEVALRAAIRDNENEILYQQTIAGSEKQIELIQQQNAILKQLDQENDAEKKALLQERYEQLVALETEQQAQDAERKAEFAQISRDADSELERQRIDQSQVLRDEDRQKLEASLLSQKEVEAKIAQDTLKTRIDSANRFKEDRQKFGVAYAEINQKINTDEVKGFEQASNNLAALQNSKNATLKTIGKAGAVASITISTAKAAMQIYEGFSVIPIIGPALGIAGAAAAVAFGAEQIRNVTGAADGALVTGGVPGRDSVPFMLEPGELVTPKRNFEEVVGAVQTQRAGGNEDQLAVLQSIDSKLSQPSQTIIQGDVLADSAFVDVLISKINDRLQYGNAQLVGTNGVLS